MGKTVMSCGVCGTARKCPVPSSWTLHYGVGYCGGCWGSFRCVICEHHDPKGVNFKGAWNCRSCRHKKLVKSTAVSHESCHQLIIEDDNGELLATAATISPPDSEDGQLPSGQGAAPWEQICEPAAAEENEDEEEECYDQLGPLPDASTKPVATDMPDDCKKRHIVLLLDASGSMRSQDVEMDKETQRSWNTSEAVITRLDAAVHCAAQFAATHAQSCPRDLFSVVVFNEEANVLTELSSALGLAEALEFFAARAAHGTHFLRALSAATKLLERHPGTQGELLLLSDGRPADTTHALEFFQRTFLAGEHQGVRLHGIGFGSTVESFAPLQQLACLSNGSFSISGFNAKGLCQAFSSVSSTITTTSNHSRGSRPEELEEKSELAKKASLRVPRPANFELPEQGVFGKHHVLHFKAKRFQFRFDGTRFHEETWAAAPVSRRTRPYMRGGMRLVYSFRDEQVVKSEEGSWMVAKCSRYLNELPNSRPIVDSHAKSTAVARHFAARFNAQVRSTALNAPKLFFVPCFVYEADSLDSNQGIEPRFFAGERYLPGVFLKYNSNNGYIAEQQLKHHEIVQSFLHFSLEASNGQLLVADLQGVARDSEVLLTDPQVLSLDRQFGLGDLGAQGLCSCLAAHRCGPTCRALGLRPVSTSLLRKLATVAGKQAPKKLGSAGRSSSCSWLHVEEPGSGLQDWDRLSEHHGSTFSDAELIGSRSNETSASSWVHVVES